MTRYVVRALRNDQRTRYTPQAATARVARYFVIVVYVAAASPVARSTESAFNDPLHAHIRHLIGLLGTGDEEEVQSCERQLSDLGIIADREIRLKYDYMNWQGREIAARLLLRLYGSTDEGLARALFDPIEAVRARAVDAHGAIGARSLPYLLSMFAAQEEKREWLYAAMIAARGVTDADGARWKTALVTCRGTLPHVGGRLVADCLSVLSGDEGVDAWRERCRSQIECVRCIAAAQALRQCGVERTEEVHRELSCLLKDTSPAVRSMAAYTLGRFYSIGGTATPDDIELLYSLLRHAQTSRWATEALAHAIEQGHRPRRVLLDKVVDMRHPAECSARLIYAMAKARVCTSAVRRTLTIALRDARPVVVSEASRGLTHLP